ncbi:MULTISPECIES: glycoside hydrolase family 3 protein [unclassified Thioalkalivibrio]|nr:MULTISPECIES: glycoside hydrolase family 3 protein [unclassified Thioalkalivibrio]
MLSIVGLLSGCLSSNDHTPALEEQVGQMLMVGFRGTEVTASDRIWGDIEERNLGGVILFNRDVPSGFALPRNVESPAQLASLNATLQSIRPDDTLLIAIDQEGGVIRRLTPTDGFPDSPSHDELGAQDDLELTHAAAAGIAETLATHGFNINFAPVVDVNTNPDNPVIARWGRSFSVDPGAVTRHARAYIDAHHERGILTTLKHFPGHGSSSEDSHDGFTDVTQSWDPLELEPYRALIDEKRVDLVMTAHVYHQGLDSQHPATLSRPVLQGLLREDLGYTGVVVSDDMQMGAIVQYYGFEEALELAIHAGNDLLVLANNADVYDPTLAQRAIQHIVARVEAGAISEQRIERSWRRIQNLKQRLATRDND